MAREFHGLTVLLIYIYISHIYLYRYYVKNGHHVIQVICNGLYFIWVFVLFLRISEAGYCYRGYPCTTTKYRSSSYTTSCGAWGQFRCTRYKYDNLIALFNYLNASFNALTINILLYWQYKIVLNKSLWKINGQSRNAFSALIKWK